MARPSVWNPRKIDTAISLYASGFSLSTIARAVEVKVSTCHRLLSRTMSAYVPACVSPAQYYAILRAQERREIALKALAGQVMPVDLQNGYQEQVAAMGRVCDALEGDLISPNLQR